MNATDGVITKLADGYLLEFDEVYPTDPADLWSAVTEPDRLRRWMTEYRGDLRLGGRWEALASDGSVWGVGEVTACDPPRSFTSIWQGAEEQPSTLVVELDPVDGGTRLRLRHEGIQSIYYGAGWQVYLEQLARHLADPPADGSDEAAWDARFGELSADWKARFESLG